MDVLYFELAAPPTGSMEQVTSSPANATHTGKNVRAVVEVNSKTPSPTLTFKFIVPAAGHPSKLYWFVAIRAFNAPGIVIFYQYRQLRPN